DPPRAEPATRAGGRHLAAVPDQDTAAPALSPRQREVMELVSRGVRNPDIAAALGVSEKTVKNHINRAFRLLEARTRVEAVLMWQRHQRHGVSRPEPAPPVGIRRPDPEGTA